MQKRTTVEARITNPRQRGKEGWFSGELITKPMHKPNRMIDIDNDGKEEPMLIVGGEIHAGPIRANVEVNVDALAAKALGTDGSGVGTEWKQ